MTGKQLAKGNLQELSILLIATILIIRTIPKVTSLNIWVMTHWVLSYENGFISRGLVGTLVKFFHPVVTLDDLYRIITIVYGLFLFILIFSLFTIMKKENNNIYLYMLVLFFTVNPGTLTMYSNAPDFGRFDTFMIIITVICLVLLANNKFVWIITFLMGAAVFIHEAFILMYAPVILAAMLFIIFWEKKNKSYITLFISSIVVLIVSFVINYLFGKPGLEYWRFVSIVQSGVEFPVHKEMIRMEYYYTIKDHFKFVLSNLSMHEFRINIIGTIIILFPTFFMFSYIWRHILLSYRKHKFLFILLILSTMTVFGLFIIGNDYGRWLSTFIFCNFMLIFFLIYKGIINTEELGKGIDRLIWSLYIIQMILYVIIGPMHEVSPFPFINDLFKQTTY